LTVFSNSAFYGGACWWRTEKLNGAAQYKPSPSIVMKTVSKFKRPNGDTVSTISTAQNVMEKKTEMQKKRRTFSPSAACKV